MFFNIQQFLNLSVSIMVGAMNKYLALTVILMGLITQIDLTLNNVSKLHEALLLHNDPYMLINFGENKTSSIRDNYSIVFYETPILNVVTIPPSSQSGWRYRVALGYEKMDIEGDGVWEIIIWYPRRLVYWSPRKGVILDLPIVSLYYTKPIALDINGDCRTDYVIYAENPYLDGHPYFPNERPQQSRVIVRNPIYVQISFTLGRGDYVSTYTYHLFGNRLFLPWVRNTPRNSTIGLLEVVFNKTITLRVHTLRTYVETTTGFINDYTTNYEVYVVGSGSRVYVIPSGLDRILQVRVTGNNVVLEREIALGYPGPNDDVAIIARPAPSIHVSAYGYALGTIRWYSPTRLSLGFDGRFIVAPYVRVFENPRSACYYYGLDEFYCRLEYLEGVVVVDLQREQYRYINLRPTEVSGTTVYVDSVNRKVYFGGLGYTPDKGYGNYVRIYRYDFNIIEGNLWSEYGLSHTQKPVVAENAAASPETVRLVLDRVYNYTIHRGRSGNYWLRVTSIVNPSYFDIDGDGATDLVFLVHYTRGDYASPCGSYQCYELYPLEVSNTYVVWFIIPKLTLTMLFPDESRNVTRLEVNFASKSSSNATLRITHKRGEEVFRKTYKPGLSADTIIFREVGEHVAYASTYSSYYTGGVVGERAYLISYNSGEKTLGSFYVRYRTRFRLVKPTITTLTPNLYVNGLNVTVILEAYDWVNRKWLPLKTESIHVLFTYGQNYCLLVRDFGGAKPPEEGPPPAPIPLNMYFDYVEACPGYSGGSLTFRGSTNINDGGYGLIIGGLKPGEIRNVTFVYNGALEKLPTSLNLGSIRLIKYPVTVSISIQNVYALTDHMGVIYARYLYLDENGEWSIGNLSSALMKVTIINQSDDTLVSEISTQVAAGVALFNIEKNKVLPGVYTVKAIYQPNDLYEESVGEAVFKVYKLTFNAKLLEKESKVELKNGDEVIIGSKIEAYGFEYVGSTVRNVTVGLKVTIINETNGETVYVGEAHGSVIEIPTENLGLGSYVLTITPRTHRWIYEPPERRFLIHIITPGRLIVEAKSMYKYVANEYNETVALTPTEIRVKLILEKKVKTLPGGKTVKLFVEDRVVEIGLNDTYVWTPIYPGLRRILATLDLTLGSKTLVISGYADIYVHKMPVEITVKAGSIVIDTKDLLGRRAPGKLYVEVRSVNRELLLKTEGNLSEEEPFAIPWMETGWFYIYVVYRGNESYREASCFTLIKSRYRLPVVSEARYIPIILILTIMASLFKQLKEHKRQSSI